MRFKNGLAYHIFIAYPKFRLIKPNQADISELYNTAFLGMTKHDVPMKVLQDTFHKLAEVTHSLMTNDDKEFLLSFKAGKPRWNLIPFNHIDKLPAVRWKLHNIARMDPEKHKAALNKLEKKLS